MNSLSTLSAISEQLATSAGSKNICTTQPQTNPVQNQSLLKALETCISSVQQMRSSVMMPARLKDVPLPQDDEPNSSTARGLPKPPSLLALTRPESMASFASAMDSGRSTPLPQSVQFTASSSSASLASLPTSDQPTSPPDHYLAYKMVTAIADQMAHGTVHSTGTRSRVRLNGEVMGEDGEGEAMPDDEADMLSDMFRATFVQPLLDALHQINDMATYIRTKYEDNV